MPPTPQRQRTKVFPTPKVADVIYRQSFNEHERVSIPSYGAAHPDSTLFPNHKLVHIKNVDEHGLQYEYWYAADRSNQEDYNFEITYPYGGSTQYPRITRTYILPRGDNSLPLGSVDPGQPLQSNGHVLTESGDDVFLPDGSSLVLTSDLANAVLVAQSERPLGNELNGLYVEVTRIYDVLPGSDDAEAGSGLNQADNGYTIERPIQDKDFLRVTWKLQLPRTVVDNGLRTNLEMCPINGYDKLRLIDEKVFGSETDNQMVNVVRIYEGNISAPSFPSPPVVARERELPGITPPEKFLLEIDRRTDTQRVDTPKLADLSIVSPEEGTLEAAKVSPDGVNSGNRIVVSSEYDPPGYLYGKTWDDNLRDYIPYSTIPMSPEDALALEPADGEEITLTPFNRYWTLVTRETPNVTSLTDASRTFYGSMPYPWPAVLRSLTLYSLPVKNTRTGEVAYEEIRHDYDMKPAWSGICRCKIQIAWSKTAPAFEAIEAMTPTSIELDWRPVASLQIPPCLHTAYSFSGTTGTDNPRYGYVAFSKTFEATNYTDWPSELVVDFDIKPYKSGYLTRKVTVYKPY